METGLHSGGYPDGRLSGPQVDGVLVSQPAGSGEWAARRERHVTVSWPSIQPCVAMAPPIPSAPVPQGVAQSHVYVPFV